MYFGGTGFAISVGLKMTFGFWIDWIVRMWLRVLEQYLQALEQMTNDQNLIPF